MESTQAYFIKPTIMKYFLPFCLMGWLGTSISLLRPVFNANTRWLFLIILFTLLLTRNIFRFLDMKLACLILIYGIWCLCTTMWSSIPILTFTKSILFVLILPTMICSGIEWTQIFSWEKSLDYLWMFAVMTLLSGLFGYNPGDKNYYHGLVTGSNMFGFMMSIAFPFFLWKTYIKSSKKIERLMWLGCAMCTFYFIFLSMSRSAILTAITILFGFFISLKPNKKFMIILSIIMFVSVVVTINPSILINKGKSFIFKGAQQSVFGSRSTAWQKSYEGATEGGWTGLGFGISFGNDNFNLNNGLTTMGYGREKGNSQLAIIEETGIIGFIIYVILLLYLSALLINMYVSVENRNQRVLIGILIGMFLGIIIQSGFEGWWYAPGGPESICFWLVVGIIRGMEINIFNKRILYGTS